MGNLAGMRATFQGALDYRTARTRRGPDRPPMDHGKEVLLDVIDGKVRVHIHCYRHDDIEGIYRVMDQYGIQVASFQHALEAYKVADLIAAHGTAIATWPDWWGFKLEAYDGIPDNARLSLGAGVSVVIHSDSANTVQRLYTEAAKLLATGMDEAAFETVVGAGPDAEHRGQTGNIEVGKDADLARHSHHPLDVYTRVEQTWIDGVQVYDRESEEPPCVTEFARRRLLGLSGSAAVAALWARGPAGVRPWRRGRGVHRDAHPVGATVLLHGERLEGAGIRMEDGVVVDIGKGVQGGEDLSGAWIVPGFTDAGCTVGLYEIGAEGATRDDRESSDAVTPDARVVDAYNPLSEVVPVTRAVGFSHVLVHPSPSGLVSGQAALFRTAGRTVAESTAASPLGLCIQLGGAGKGSGGPDSRMGIAMRLRALLEDAEPAPDAPADDPPRRRRRTEPESDKEEEPSGDERIWRDVRSGALPVLFHADRADDLLQAVGLAQEYGVRAVLVGGAEGWIVADELAAAGCPCCWDRPPPGPIRSAAACATTMPRCMRPVSDSPSGRGRTTSPEGCGPRLACLWHTGFPGKQPSRGSRVRSGRSLASTAMGASRQVGRPVSS